LFFLRRQVLIAQGFAGKCFSFYRAAVPVCDEWQWRFAWWLSLHVIFQHDGPQMSILTWRCGMSKSGIMTSFLDPAANIPQSAETRLNTGKTTNFPLPHVTG
jgi:hypothetical protein